MQPVMTAGLSVEHLLLFAGIFVLLFGGKKIGEFGKGLGEGIRNFKPVGWVLEAESGFVVVGPGTGGNHRGVAVSLNEDRIAWTSAKRWPVRLLAQAGGEQQAVLR